MLFSSFLKYIAVVADVMRPSQRYSSTASYYCKPIVSELEDVTSLQAQPTLSSTINPVHISTTISFTFISMLTFHLLNKREKEKYFGFPYLGIFCPM
jgi:hypothetical protein